jgi:hypothetical protein
MHLSADEKKKAANPKRDKEVHQQSKRAEQRQQASRRGRDNTRECTTQRFEALGSTYSACARCQRVSGVDSDNGTRSPQT